MKINNYILKGCLVLSALALFNCGDELQKADQDVEGLTGEGQKPNVTASIATTSVNEAGSPQVAINVYLDKPVDFNIPFEAVRIGGTASDADFSAAVGTIPAYQTEGTIMLTISDDIYPEDTETLELEITPSGIPYIYEAKGRPTVSLDITNNATDNFTFQLSWDTEYVDSDGDAHSACDFDLDLEIYTAAFGGPLATSYGDCPESITLSPGDLADGNYWLIPSFWTVASGVPPATDFQIPAMMTVGKPGVWIETVDLTEQWDTATGGNQEGNPDAYLVKYVLNISGTTYTVTDADTGSVVGTGRMSAPSVKTPSNFVGGRQ